MDGKNPAPVDMCFIPVLKEGFNHAFGDAGFRNHPRIGPPPWDAQHMRRIAKHGPRGGDRFFFPGKPAVSRDQTCGDDGRKINTNI